MNAVKTIKVRIPCLVDSEGKYWASQWTKDDLTLALPDDVEAFAFLEEEFEDCREIKLVWINAEIPLPDQSSIEVEGTVEA